MSPATETSDTNWRIVILAVACGVLGAMQVGKVPLALPGIRAEFGLDLAAGGFVASLFNLLGATLGFFAGIAADRIGHRRAALLGLVVLALGSVLGGLAPSTAFLYLARFAEGFGFVLIIVAAPALIARATASRHLSIALGAWGTYMPMGMMVVMVVSPSILSATDWRGLWLLNGGAIVAFAIVFAMSTRRAPPQLTARSLSDSVQVLTNKGAWLLAVTFALYTIQWMGIMTWLPTILLDDMGFSLAAAATFTVIAIGVSILGNLGAGWLVQRGWPHWLTLTIGHVAMGAGAWVLFRTDFPDEIRLGAVVIFSLLGGAVPASMFSALLTFVRAPSLVGAANGMLVQGNNIGSFTGAPLLGALAASALGWEALNIVLPTLAGVAIVMALMLRRIGENGRST